MDTGDMPVGLVVSTDLADSPVGGLMDTPSPFKNSTGREIEISDRSHVEEDLTPLKSALSTDVHGNKKAKEDDGSCLKRNVSWADFHDAAALTTVVEFERDPAPSSPTSIDSWEGASDSGCVCCSIQ